MWARVGAAIRGGGTLRLQSGIRYVRMYPGTRITGMVIILSLIKIKRKNIVSNNLIPVLTRNFPAAGRLAAIFSLGFVLKVDAWYSCGSCAPPEDCDDDDVRSIPEFKFGECVGEFALEDTVVDEGDEDLIIVGMLGTVLLLANEGGSGEGEEGEP